jgi:hypothetical protein
VREPLAEPVGQAAQAAPAARPVMLARARLWASASARAQALELEREASALWAPRPGEAPRGVPAGPTTLAERRALVELVERPALRAPEARRMPVQPRALAELRALAARA